MRSSKASREYGENANKKTLYLVEMQSFTEKMFYKKWLCWSSSPGPTTLMELEPRTHNINMIYLAMIKLMIKRLHN